ncbi:P-loop containing nucleoside triphosphate hydrolase protein [Xylaria venustula]|nr:P-loop containing nucleoside triphosphate hydrolase protein [Xylaria venustula]
MDKYESIHGRDVSSFDFTSTHRLPTISAAQAFDDLETDPRQFVPTGLEALDTALANISVEDRDGLSRRRGFQKGQIAEIWGPPASGKTTFGMQIAANTLLDGGKVVWVDTFTPICYHRLSKVIGSSCSIPGGTTTPLDATDAIAHLVHYFTPSLAHFIGLVCKPEPSSIPKGTSLVVIDGLSGLINHAFPKNLDPHRNHKGPSSATRRVQVLQSISSALQKLSATRDLLVVVLSQCVTRMQVENGAAITPAISTSTWEQGIATRLVLFQDWTMVDAELHNIRLVGVQKSNGQVRRDTSELVLPFEICNGGLVGLDPEPSQASLAFATNRRRQKRKFDGNDYEIADSEGEDYGWEDEDEADMPDMPPQWQGSEDLLLGRGYDDDDDDDDNTDLTAEISPRGNTTPASSQSGD